MYNVVHSNFAHNNGTDPNNPWGCGIVFWYTSNNLAYNNILSANKYCGIQLRHGNKIYNNTIYANESRGIVLGSNVIDAQIINNIIYQSGQPAIDDRGTNTVISHNLETNPQFVSRLIFI
ncbi:MAG: right-handed parallel beta-helix repeat-containing protein [Myxococcota bacterium]